MDDTDSNKNEKNKNELFVITGGANDGGESRPRSDSSIAISNSDAPRQLSKTVNLVKQKATPWLQARAEEVFAQVDDSLFSMAEKAHQQEEQDRLFQAIRALRVDLADVVDGFCDGVEDRFTTPRNDSPGEDGSSAPVVSLKSLSLVKDEDLEQQVAIRTMVANVKRDHAESIGALSLRLDTLLPRKIYDENMPLGPASICAAFAQVLEEVDLSLLARMTVFKKFEVHLVNRLGELYDSCNSALIEQGVLPSIEDPLRHQNRKSAHSQPRPPQGSALPATDAQAPGSSPSGQMGAMGYAPGSQDLSTAAVGFAGGSPGTSHSPGASHSPSAPYAPGTSAGASAGGNFAPGLMPVGSGASPLATPTLLQHLGQFQMTMPIQSVASGQLVNVTELLQEQLKAAKQSASLHELDSEVIRLVDMLFSFMLEDRNLAEPIKVQLIRLQLPMLKLAVADKAFFSKGGHPARRLLNELADAAIGWQPSENYLSDPLYREVCTIVEGVLSEYDEDEHVFVRLLEMFGEFSERERKRAAIMEKRTIDEAQGTARVGTAKARVTAVFDALTAERELPKIVHDWLSRVWSSVLFRTCLKEGTNSGVWRQQVLTVRDLIWSVVAPMPESGVKMRRLLPDLKRRLEEGAQSLSLNTGDRQRLLNGLEVLYQDRQKLGERVESERERRTRERLVQELRREVDSVLAIPDQELEMPVSVAEPAADTVLDDSRELLPTQPALPAVEEIQQVVTNITLDKSAALNPMPEEDRHWQQTYHLKDSWFLLRHPEKLPVRGRLAAIIRDLDQFMFVNRRGTKVGIYSRLELAHALRNGELLPLEQGPLFERALEYVVGSCGDSKIDISV